MVTNPATPASNASKLHSSRKRPLSTTEKTMIRHRFIAALAFAAASWAGAAWASTPTSESALPGSSVAVAGPWAGESNADPAFAPEGNTVVFAHGKGTQRRLYVSHRRDGVWSAPALAPFSRRWMNFEPYMAPDGSYLLFISNRPAKAGGGVLDGYFGGKVRPKRGGNMWRVDFAHGEWGKPVRLPGIVNVSTATYSPAVAADGRVYFTHPDPHTRHTRIYVARRVDGKFQAPQPVAFSNGVISDYDPAVAPDGSFIVFSSDRPPTPRNHSGLFVAFRSGDGWSRPEPLGVYGYEARLSPDARTLYFNADSDGRIHHFDLAAWRTRHDRRTAM
jgi:hypothetical protein